MPPSKKKPTRRKPIAPPRAKPKARTRAKAKPAARTKPKPAARRTTSKPKPAARRLTPRPKPRARAPRYEEPLERPSLLTTEEFVAEQPSSPRAVPIGASKPIWEPPDDPLTARPEQRVVEAPTDTAPHVDRPFAELAAGAFAMLLAISVFFPWYHNLIGTVNGWSSGTWGPIVFFAALMALAIVVLRRAGVAIEFPVEPTLLIEGIGWLCVIGLILKRYFSPQIAGAKLPTDGWIFASLVLALGLAVTAGWASSNAPFVIRKTWFHDRAGQIGSAVLALALIGGLSFGFVNAVGTVGTTGPTIVQPHLVRGSPKCAAKLHIPTPSGFTATQGYDIQGNPTTCVAYFSTTLKLDVAFGRFTAGLRAAGWTVTPSRPTPISRTATMKGSACGSVTMVVQAGRPTTAYVSVFPCPTPTPKK